ncbi:hypothetical protein AWC38_SpisGene21584 [Stylophora pistillata]|uniref:Peptidase aspartic putative domain-containing protein n=1 Tax=Stylophora pistillata TaxID=50429 RepID=A0A2B4RDA1_STYPI|nr:hypothetical protein AWC38_SpisGene21584 [Stylophora pistillata]
MKRKDSVSSSISRGICDIMIYEGWHAKEDLTKFVERLAVIKNDPGFAGVVAMPTMKTRGNKKKPPNRTKFLPNPRQTSSFATDFSAKDPGRRPGTDDGQSKPLLEVQSCLCCSGSHKLASCLDFQNKDLQTRWDIVKRHRLCHVFMRPGNRRGSCESQKFCPCGSGKRHHRFLHNPPRRDIGDTDRGNKTREREQQPAENQPNSRNGEHRSTTELRSTVQYATAIELTKKKTMFLHVIPVKISSSDGKSITTYGLLDNGSRGTMISSDVAYELDLKSRKEVVSVSTHLQKEDEDIEVIEFELQSAGREGEAITAEEGLVSEKFNIAEKCLPGDIDRRSHPHLTDIEIPDVKLRKVAVLIGKDINDAHEVFEVRKSDKPDSQLQALRGPLS